MGYNLTTIKTGKRVTLRLPAIAVVHDTANDYGRGIVEGVLRYENSHGPWRLQLFNLGSEDQLRVPTGWKGDGVIAAVRTSAMARNLLKWRLPIVNVSGCQVPKLSIPTVRNDVGAFDSSGNRTLTGARIPEVRFLQRTTPFSKPFAGYVFSRDGRD